METEEAHAGRVYRSLSQRISLDAQRMVTRGFLTCMPEKEERIYAFVRLGYRIGPAVVRDLTDPQGGAAGDCSDPSEGRGSPATGFLRFSEQGGVLTAEIEPKNRVLPLLRPHFCARYSGERFVIYDRTHREALFYQPGRWAIVPLERFVPARRGRRSWITAGYGGGSTIPSPSRDAIIPSAV